MIGVSRYVCHVGLYALLMYVLCNVSLLRVLCLVDLCLVDMLIYILDMPMVRPVEFICLMISLS